MPPAHSWTRDSTAPTGGETLLRGVWSGMWVGNGSVRVQSGHDELQDSGQSCSKPYGAGGYNPPPQEGPVTLAARGTEESTASATKRAADPFRGLSKSNSNTATASNPENVIFGFLLKALVGGPY